MLDAVARARELDAFASEHDAQLSITLHARQTAWSAGYVQQNAARLGLVPGVLPGRMVLPAALSGLPPLLSLQYDPQAVLSDDPAQTAIWQIVLSLDVAQVPREDQAYARMTDIAARLAEVMDACAVAPQSAADILPVLFKRALDLHQTTFAMGESVAHLHALWLAGRLVRTRGADGVWRFGTPG